MENVKGFEEDMEGILNEAGDGFGNMGIFLIFKKVIKKLSVKINNIMRAFFSILDIYFYYNFLIWTLIEFGNFFSLIYKKINLKI